MALVIIAIIELIIIIYLDRKNIKNYKNYKLSVVLFIIFTIINYNLIINIAELDRILEESENNLIDKMAIVLLSVSLSLVYNILLAPIIQKYYENKILKYYEKKMKVQKYDYYRDILINISPAIIAYCYNKKINIKDTVIAILLNLELKNIIKIEENKIIILNDTVELSNHEKLVLDIIEKQNFKESNFKKIFKQTLIDDMIKAEYLSIHTKENKSFNIIYFYELILAWVITYISTTLFLFMSFSNLGIFMVYIYLCIFISLPIYKLIQRKIKVISRKREALELAAKIKGVKNYINDYSMIKDRKIDIIKLYEEYVIYAIILDIKGNLNNDCNKLYESIKNRKEFVNS